MLHVASHTKVVGTFICSICKLTCRHMDTYYYSHLRVFFIHIVVWGLLHCVNMVMSISTMYGVIYQSSQVSPAIYSATLY